MNTTRCHPRTASEAFRDLDYSCPLKKPAPVCAADKVVAWACVIGFLAAIAAVIWG